MQFVRVESVLQQAQQLLQQRKFPEADHILNIALAQQLNSADVLYLTATSQLVQGHHGAAIHLLRKVVEMHPGYANAYLNLGVVLRREGYVEEARAALERAVELNPADADGWNNIAATYINEGDPVPGEWAARRALQLNPHMEKAHWNLGLLLLEQQKWAEGWDEYTHGVGAFERNLRNYTPGGKTPLLEKLDDLQEGQTVVVFGEQGLGDEILFASCLTHFLIDASNRDAKVIFDAHPRLVEVFKARWPELRIEGTRKEQTISEWVLRDDVSVDWCIPVGNLPRFYRRFPDCFPERGDYLRRQGADFHHKLRERLGGEEKPLVGLAWTGGIRKTMAAYRIVEPKRLGPILAQDAHFISLQYDDDRADIEFIEREFGVKVHSFPAITQAFDYQHTFDLVASLDLVITVPTSVHHVAGAVGTECWLMSHKHAAWREATRSTELIWYPKTHTVLHRPDDVETQCRCDGTVHGERETETWNGWDRVVDTVGDALREFCNDWRG